MSLVKKRIDHKETDEIDVGRLVGEIIDHRKLIISVTALFTLLSLLYAIFATPIYQADALLQIEQKQGNAILIVSVKCYLIANHNLLLKLLCFSRG